MTSRVFLCQVYVKILEVPFAKLAFKTLLNVIPFLLLAHSVIFPLRLDLDVNMNVPFA